MKSLGDKPLFQLRLNSYKKPGNSAYLAFIGVIIVRLTATAITFTATTTHLAHF